MKDLSLYIHIPFCIQKCYYCDFLSFSSDESTISSYFDALYSEIESLTLSQEYLVKTIFIGGGTPTLVDSRYMVRLLELLRSHFSIDGNAEISIESNPATFDEGKLADYRKIGINRISIGLQCWQDELLQSIGRVHSRDDFVKGYHLAREVGFNNINVDLIFGLPGQSLEDWKETIENVVQLGPTHLSCYSLILEEGTVLYNKVRKNNIVIRDDLERQMYYYAQDYLHQKDYIQYEISNFSKKAMECKHNLVYWEMTPYIGVGLGAHSYFEGVRYHNEENIKKYISDIKNSHSILRDRIPLSKESMKEEFVFLGLRKIKGIQDSVYSELFGTSIFKDYQDEIVGLASEDYIQVEGENIRLSKKGLDFANHVFMTFLK